MSARVDSAPRLCVITACEVVYYSQTRGRQLKRFSVCIAAVSNAPRNKSPTQTPTITAPEHTHQIHPQWLSVIS